MGSFACQKPLDGSGLHAVSSSAFLQEIRHFRLLADSFEKGLTKLFRFAILRAMLFVYNISFRSALRRIATIACPAGHMER